MRVGSADWTDLLPEGVENLWLEDMSSPAVAGLPGANSSMTVNTTMKKCFIDWSFRDCEAGSQGGGRAGSEAGVQTSGKRELALSGQTRKPLHPNRLSTYLHGGNVLFRIDSINSERTEYCNTIVLRAARSS